MEDLSREEMYKKLKEKNLLYKGKYLFLDKESQTQPYWYVEDLSQDKGFDDNVLISFDKKTIINLWSDYDKITDEQVKIIEKDFPFHVSRLKYLRKKFKANKSEKVSLIFKIEHVDWGLKCYGEWDNTKYSIYDDMSMKIVKDYTTRKYTMKTILSRNDYNKINKLMEDIDKIDENVDACDGDAWSFKYYEDGKIYKKRKLDYILTLNH